MEIITAEITDKLTLFAHGRIDTSNASAATDAINGFLAQYSGNDVILDIEDLVYISSAGLRSILALRKKKAGLKIINASSDVYEILEMTGFTEMIDVEKAYKRVSIERCEVIGTGANGKVYRIDPETIIKVYINADSLPDIQRERELARSAFVLGIPTAISYDVVKVGDSYASVFELLNAKSISKLLAADPANADSYIGMYVDLLKKIHSTSVPEGQMPNIKTTVVRWVDDIKGKIADDKWEKLHTLTLAVPESDRMIHGDYHTKNVMVQDGEVLLIDMDTIAHGNPVFEFASVFNAYVGFKSIDPESTKGFLGIDDDMMQYVWDKTLELYFGTADKAVLGVCEDKAAIIGYTRLLRRTVKRVPDDNPGKSAMIEKCRTEIENRLDRIDTLIL